jgi:hypothetical protein
MHQEIIIIHQLSYFAIDPILSYFHHITDTIVETRLIMRKLSNIYTKQNRILWNAFGPIGLNLLVIESKTSW